MAQRISIDDVLLDLKSLAGEARAHRMRRLGRDALKKGQSPVLSLTAAVSASLVSAAAKEEEIDPLAGLVAVDDLSAFGEDCLPGLNYASDETHDHASADDSHPSHHGHASYLADPFASKFANVYARAHEGHGEHDDVAAAHASHGEMGHGEMGHGDIGDGAAHMGQHDKRHGAHHSRDGHQHGGAGQSSSHHPSAEHASDEHEQHESGHDMSVHSLAGHAGGHSAHAGHANHSVHAASADSITHMDHMLPEGSETGEAATELDQAIGALVQDHDGAHGSNASDHETDAITSEHAHHHPTLAELDTTPTDDLAAVQTPPVV